MISASLKLGGDRVSSGSGDAGDDIEGTDGEGEETESAGCTVFSVDCWEGSSGEGDAWSVTGSAEDAGKGASELNIAVSC